MATEWKKANDPTSPASAGTPFSVLLTITYRDRTESRLVTLPATLGRGPEADVCLADLWTSRMHCTLDEVCGTVVVRDLFSKNGIFVNGLRVEESHLRPGDRFTLGITDVTLEYPPRTAPIVPLAVVVPAPGPIPDTRELPDTAH